MHLRGTAQRVGVLHAAAGDVGLPDLASFEVMEKIGSALQLARKWPGLMNTRIEGSRRTAQAVDGHGADEVGRFDQIFSLQKLKAADRQHRLSAIQERDALLGCQHDRLELSALQRLGAGILDAIEFRLALADQDERDVSQRRKVATCSHAALRWHYGRDAAI